MYLLYLDDFFRRLFTMPCFYKKDEALATKLVTRFPDQQPSHHSTILLFNSQTGAVQSVSLCDCFTVLYTYLNRFKMYSIIQ